MFWTEIRELNLLFIRNWLPYQELTSSLNIHLMPPAFVFNWNKITTSTFHKNMTASQTRTAHEFWKFYQVNTQMPLRMFATLTGLYVHTKNGVVKGSDEHLGNLPHLIVIHACLMSNFTRLRWVPKTPAMTHFKFPSIAFNRCFEQK